MKVVCLEAYLMKLLTAIEEIMPVKPPSLAVNVFRFAHFLPGIATSKIQISFFSPTYNFCPVGSKAKLRAATTSSTWS